MAALEAELSAAAQRLAQADSAARLHLREGERLERTAEAARVEAAEAGVRQGEAEAAAKRAEGDCANLRAKLVQAEAAVKASVGGGQHVCEQGLGQGVRRQPRTRPSRHPSSINHLFSNPPLSIAQ